MNSRKKWGSRKYDLYLIKERQLEILKLNKIVYIYFCKWTLSLFLHFDMLPVSNVILTFSRESCPDTRNQQRTKLTGLKVVWVQTLCLPLCGRRGTSQRTCSNNKELKKKEKWAICQVHTLQYLKSLRQIFLGLSLQILHVHYATYETIGVPVLL